MARLRKKKRTHLGANNGLKNVQSSNASLSKDPKSMVIRIGASEVGSSVTQLVKDVRAMMAPGTASRLKERRSNRLRDYVTMAGPLGVSHLLLFSRSSSGNTNLRIALTPRGPTLNFRVENYALAKDIKKSMKNPLGGGNEYINPPLLVMNNFLTSEAESAGPQAKVPKHLEQLTTSLFQSLFPPLSPQNMPLSSIKRTLLLNREVQPSSLEDGSDSGTYIISLRHYAITTRRTGLPRALRRLSGSGKKSISSKTKAAVPNLGKLGDVSDYLLQPNTGYASASESEIETDAEVEVLAQSTQKTANPKKKKQEESGPAPEKRAVKLVELGPRMRLRLMKVEEGMCDGKVMWHEYVKKSKNEAEGLEEMWETRRKEKERRKKEQKENVAKKKSAKEGSKEDKADDPMDVDEWDSEDNFLEDDEGEAGEDGEEDGAMNEDEGPIEVPIG